MRKIDRYIMVCVTQSILIVLFVLAGVMFIATLMGELSAISSHGYTLLKAFEYSLLFVPSEIYSLLPMAGFVGALMGLSQIALQNELTVIRAVGMSRWQVTWALMKASIVIIIVITAIAELYSFHWLDRAQMIKSPKLKHQTNSLQKNFWIKTKGGMLNVGSGESQTELDNVTFFIFKNKIDLQSVLIAKKAILQKDHWALINPTQTTFLSDKVVSKSLKQYALPFFDYQKKFVDDSSFDPNQMSIKELYADTFYRSSHGFAPDQISYAFWVRLFQPLTSLVMIWLGVPFVYGSLRDASMGYRLVIGILIGFLIYIVNQMIGPLCMIYQMPAWLAAVVPITMLFLFGMYLLKRSR